MTVRQCRQDLERQFFGIDQTLVRQPVIGRQDQVIPPAELTFMAQRAHSQITYVDAGHLSMITQPRTVADVITDAAIATG